MTEGLDIDLDLMTGWIDSGFRAENSNPFAAPLLHPIFEAEPEAEKRRKPKSSNKKEKQLDGTFLPLSIR